MSIILLCAYAACTPRVVLAITYDSLQDEYFDTIEDHMGAGTENIGIRFGTTLQESLRFNRSTNLFETSAGVEVHGTMSGESLVAANAGVATVPTDARFHIKGGGIGQKFRYETKLSEYSLRIGGGFNGVADEVAITSGAGVESHESDTTAPAWAINFSGLSDNLTILHGVNNGAKSAVTWNEFFRIDSQGDIGIGLGQVDAEQKLEVGGTISGASLFSMQSLSSSGTLVTEGRSTFNGVTVFNEDSSSSSHVRMEGDSNANLFFLDATNDRIGIGTSAPDSIFDVAGTLSGTSLVVTNLKSCDTIDTDASGALSCGTDNAGSGGAPDTGIFLDTNPAAFADNDTTELFNDATKPQIVTDAATSTVLVSVHMHGAASNTANDTFLAARIVFTTNGNNPSCNSDAQVGEVMVGGFTTATTHPWQVSGTMLHNPGVAGTIKYTVCTSTVSMGTATDTPEDVRVSLIEFGD